MSLSRRLPALLIALLMLTLAPISSAGTAPTNGGPHLVESDATWDADGQMNAQVVVKAGATLTVEAQITVALGASITVEQGATLRMENGGLRAEEGPTAVRPISLSENASLMAHSGVATGAFSLHIVAAEGSALDGWTVAWDEIPAQDMNGSVHTINFSAPRDDFRVFFDLPPGRLGDLVIAELQIEDHGTQTVDIMPAIGAQPIDCFLAGEPGFDLTIHGSAHLENSVVQGADIEITGAVTTISSDLKASGPVMVHGAEGSLDMQGGSVTLSRVDHDVELDAFAEIEWGAATGSGGLIDRWERVVPAQTIHIPVDGMDCVGTPCVRYIYHGLGGPDAGASPLRTVGTEGNVTVPARTVEIGWADSTDVWTESATIEVETFRSAWNMGSSMDSWSRTTFVDLPYDVEVFEILPELDHPVISLDSVVFTDETGDIGRTIPVEITASNSGTETATVFIRCDLTGSDTFADISPKWAEMTLEPGESETVESRWSYHEATEQGLSCFVEKPDQFLDPSPFFGERSADSSRAGETGIATVAWSQADEAGSPILMLAALGITVVIVLVVVFKLSRAGPVSDEEEDLDVEDAAEDAARVDRFAELMADEDED